MNLYLWHWPQWTFAVLFTITIVGNAYMHNKPQKGKYSIFHAIINVAITAYILAQGGFWG